MPVGGYYIEVDGADELKCALEGTASGIRDLSRAHREIGKMAGAYVKAHEPLPSGGAGRAGHNRGTYDGMLQASTRGGGGKSGAYVQAAAPYLFVQEFGGTSFWHKSGAGTLRAANRAHVKVTHAAAATGTRGHVIYKKPRRGAGYFIWNVAFRLRSRIGRQYMDDLERIGQSHGLGIETTSANLDIEAMPGPTRG